MLKKEKNTQISFKKHLFNLLLISVLYSCDNTGVKTVKNSEKAVFENVSLEIPPEIRIEKGKKMALYELIGPTTDTIRTYHFGNAITTIEENVKRWESQFDTLLYSNTELNQLISITELEGKKNGETKYNYGVIIPTNAGPYYLKSSSTTIERKESTKAVLQKLIDSAVYN